jgi:hypothetical protein
VTAGSPQWSRRRREATLPQTGDVEIKGGEAVLFRENRATGLRPASVSGSAHQSQGLAQNDEAQARWLTWTSLTGVGCIEAATLQPDTRSL